MLQWKKKPGEAVAIDEILIDVETDKVVLEVPAPAAGVLIVKLVQPDGATVAAEQVIAQDRYNGDFSCGSCLSPAPATVAAGSRLLSHAINRQFRRLQLGPGP